MPREAAPAQTLGRAGDAFLRLFSPFCFAKVPSGLRQPLPAVMAAARGLALPAPGTGSSPVSFGQSSVQKQTSPRSLPCWSRSPGPSGVFSAAHLISLPNAEELDRRLPSLSTGAFLYIRMYGKLCWPRRCHIMIEVPEKDAPKEESALRGLLGREAEGAGSWPAPRAALRSEVRGE